MLVAEDLLIFCILLGNSSVNFEVTLKKKTQTLNERNYLVKLLCKQKQYIRDHRQSLSGPKHTWSDTRKALVESVTDTIQEKTKVELVSCELLVIKTDTILDVKNKFQVSIIFQIRWKEDPVIKIISPCGTILKEIVEVRISAPTELTTILLALPLNIIALSQKDVKPLSSVFIYYERFSLFYTVI